MCFGGGTVLWWPSLLLLKLIYPINGWIWFFIWCYAQATHMQLSICMYTWNESILMNNYPPEIHSLQSSIIEHLRTKLAYILYYMIWSLGLWWLQQSVNDPLQSCSKDWLYHRDLSLHIMYVRERVLGRKITDQVGWSTWSAIFLPRTFSPELIQACGSLWTGSAIYQSDSGKHSHCMQGTVGQYLTVYSRPN